MNTENPDQTPTTEADAFETSLGHAVTQYRMAEAVAKIRTLEHQRDTARAEAKEAKETIDTWITSDKRTAELNRLSEWKASAMRVMEPIQDIGKAIGARLGEDILPQVVPAIAALRAEVDRLTKERDDKHALAESYSGRFHEAIAKRNTVGKEAMRDQRSASYSAESVAFWSKSLPSVQGLWWWWNEDEDSLPIPVSIMYSGTSDSYFASEGQWGWTRFQNVEDMGGFWMRCYEPLSPTTREQGNTSPSPSPALEKLAREIDGLYEAPSRIRPLRRILEREFGVRQSDSETANEIRKVFPMADQGRGYEALMTQSVESILSRFREHELRELRECGRLKFLINERHALLGYIESSRDINTRAVSSGCLDLNTWLVGLRKYAKDFDDAIQLSAHLRTVDASKSGGCGASAGEYKTEWIAEDALTQIEKELKP